MLSLLNPRHAELKSKMVPETAIFFFHSSKKIASLWIVYQNVLQHEKESCCSSVIQALPSYTVIEKIVEPLGTSVMAVWWDSIWLQISKRSWSWSCLELQKTWCKLWIFRSVQLFCKRIQCLFYATVCDIAALKIQIGDR